MKNPIHSCTLNLFNENRLVFMTPPEGPKGPEKSVEAKEKATTPKEKPDTKAIKDALRDLYKLRTELKDGLKLHPENKGFQAMLEKINGTITKLEGKLNNKLPKPKFDPTKPDWEGGELPKREGPINVNEPDFGEPETKNKRPIKPVNVNEPDF